MKNIAKVDYRYSDPERPSGSKLNLLEIISLFDNSVSIDWLIQLTGQKISYALQVLNNSIRERIIEEVDPGRYRFRNELPQRTQRNYHDAIPEKERKQIHRDIVTILGNEQLQEPWMIEEIAYHLIQCGQELESCNHLIEAGNLYNQKSEFDAAINCYRKVIDLLRLEKTPEADVLFIETVLKVEEIFVFRQDSQWILDVLNEALKRAERSNNHSTILLIEMFLAITLWQRGDHRQAKKKYDLVSASIDIVDNPDIQRQLMAIRIHFLAWLSRYRESIEAYEKTTQDIVSYPKGKLPLYSSIVVAHVYAIAGQVNTGLGMLESVYAHCIEQKAFYIAGCALVHLAQIFLMLGKLNDSLNTLNKIEKEFPPVDAHLEAEVKEIKAYVLYLMGKRQASEKYLKDYFKFLKDNALARRSTYYLMAFALMIHKGDYAPIEGLNIEDEIARAMQSENLLFKGLAQYSLALLKQENGDDEQSIIDSYQMSLQLLEESGHRFESAKLRIENARLQLSLGNAEAATEVLKPLTSVDSPFNLSTIPNDLKFLLNQRPSEKNILQDILKFGQDMVTIRNDKELVNYVVTTVCSVTGAERAAIFMLKQMNSGNRVTLRATINLTRDDILRSDFTPSMELIEEVAISGEGLIRKIEQSASKKDVPFKTVRSCICVPMVIKNQTVGVLYLDNRFLASAFKKDDLKTLTYFAALAAITIDNTEAYAEINRLNRKLTEEKKYYQEQHLENMNIGSIVGDGQEIQSVLKQIERVAPTDTTVLILGETGVGKELIAGTILDNSLRRDEPFVCVNCSAFSKDLIASELFGHEKGAFTGANERHIGRFELADGGTLFMDEIGDIPMETQVRLLRVLQTKEYERVGGKKTLKSDFRLVAATNQNLEKQVSEGKFREDLYYRLNVFPIVIPPLRERKDDIPLLVNHFLSNFSRKAGKCFNKLSEQQLSQLKTYKWPGNVRELEHIVERAVIMSSEPELRLPDLDIKKPAPDEFDDILTMAEAEKRHLIRALEKTKWKIRGPGGAAELLDMHYSTLRARIRKHNIRKRLLIVR